MTTDHDASHPATRDRDRDRDLTMLEDAATVRAVRRELGYLLGPLAEERMWRPFSDQDTDRAFDELLGRGRAREAREAWARLDAAVRTAVADATTG